MKGGEHMTTGERIKAARKKAGLTQAELASKLGISYVGVSQWENNLRNPKPETLRRIADALDVDWLELYGEPTEEDKADLIKVIQSIGMPHGPDGSATVAETQQLLRRVGELYGEQSVLLLKLTSIMNEEGVDKVIEYTKSIFQEYMDESIPRE